MSLSQVPPETIKLIEDKVAKCNVQDKSLEEIAQIVSNTTNHYQYGYGTCRAFNTLNFFPWPHEVEQLQEVCCGTTALFRFLFAYILKEKNNLSFNLGFLLSKNFEHASVGLSSNSESYVLARSTPSKIDFEGLNLELEDVLMLVNNVRKIEPLDALGKDQILIRTDFTNNSYLETNGHLYLETNDLTVRYDGNSVVFNLVLFRSYGTTSGTWVKLGYEGDRIQLQKYDYVCPGKYYEWYPFNFQHCIDYNKDSPEILDIREESLRCIVLEAIFPYVFTKVMREKKKILL